MKKAKFEMDYLKQTRVLSRSAFIALEKEIVSDIEKITEKYGKVKKTLEEHCKKSTNPKFNKINDEHVNVNIKIDNNELRRKRKEFEPVYVNILFETDHEIEQEWFSLDGTKNHRTYKPITSTEFGEINLFLFYVKGKYELDTKKNKFVLTSNNYEINTDKNPYVRFNRITELNMSHFDNNKFNSSKLFRDFKDYSKGITGSLDLQIEKLIKQRIAERSAEMTSIGKHYFF